MSSEWGSPCTIECYVICEKCYQILCADHCSAHCSVWTVFEMDSNVPVPMHHVYTPIAGGTDVACLEYAITQVPIKRSRNQGFIDSR